MAAASASPRRPWASRRGPLKRLWPTQRNAWLSGTRSRSFRRSNLCSPICPPNWTPPACSSAAPPGSRIPVHALAWKLRWPSSSPAKWPLVWLTKRFRFTAATATAANIRSNATTATRGSPRFTKAPPKFSASSSPPGPCARNYSHLIVLNWPRIAIPISLIRILPAAPAGRLVWPLFSSPTATLPSRLPLALPVAALDYADAPLAHHRSPHGQRGRPAARRTDRPTRHPYAARSASLPALPLARPHPFLQNSRPAAERHLHLLRQSDERPGHPCPARTRRHLPPACAGRDRLASLQILSWRLS